MILNSDAIQNCSQMVCGKINVKWVFEGDIKGCFDNFSHTWLLENTTYKLETYT